MLNYNSPGSTPSGTRSDIDATSSSQMNTYHWFKNAIITARKEQYFMPLASAINMPKHYGKTVKVYEYVPLLDQRNVNSQGIDAAGATISGSGNLYGSSRDIGTITSKLPVLGENGGRVNRVGFTRLQREGSIHKFGFFHEFNQESMDFDSDEGLMDHLSRELMSGAVQLTEAVLQKDILAAAGTVLYAGAATSPSTVSGQIVPATTGGSPTPEIPASIVSYKNLMRLDQILTDNRTPKQTTVISGSRLIDTKTLPSARVMFVGSELVPLLKAMTDLFGNKAFIAVQHYADAGTILNGEIGTIDAFRIVQVPEMLNWAGAGAPATANPGFRTTTVSGTERYDVFPMLVIGDDSFSTIGFQTDGKTLKFAVMTKMPGRETAHAATDPFGETGFSSIKWYYGILIKRPERIAVVKTVAPI
ncbi:N4-gp56 family major capsid protein [Roseococcus sp.]|uniref:N4-gp56 family major capsid protein n=1 Tax=Roseococcus sp. TaxID=2109646 RepID=UPI003BAA00CE